MQLDFARESYLTILWSLCRRFRSQKNVQCWYYAAITSTVRPKNLERGCGFPTIAIASCPADFEPRRHDPISVTTFFPGSTFLCLDSKPAAPPAS